MSRKKLCILVKSFSPSAKQHTPHVCAWRQLSTLRNDFREVRDLSYVEAVEVEPSTQSEQQHEMQFALCFMDSAFVHLTAGSSLRENEACFTLKELRTYRGRMCRDLSSAKEMRPCGTAATEIL